MKTLIIIPSRLLSTRLPNKPLADICGEPMIVHVWRRAMESNIAPVIVACDDTRVCDVINKVGGEAILTNPDLPSGTDRIYSALKRLNKPYEIIINLQGDLPCINPTIIKDVLLPFKNSKVDISTLAVKIKNKEDLENPNVVKVALSLKQGETVGRAIYFSRNLIPANKGEFFHHIGIYAFKYKSLCDFIKLPTSVLEEREKLEQLRALEDGMRIDVSIVDEVPLSVDTGDDLNKVREFLKSKKS